MRGHTTFPPHLFRLSDGYHRQPSGKHHRGRLCRKVLGVVRGFHAKVAKPSNNCDEAQGWARAAEGTSRMRPRGNRLRFRARIKCRLQRFGDHNATLVERPAVCARPFVLPTAKPESPLGPLGSLSSQYRRTLELVLQKSHASFRITSSFPVQRISLRPRTYPQKCLWSHWISQSVRRGGQETGAASATRESRESTPTAPWFGKKRELVGGWQSHLRAFIDGRSVLRVRASEGRSACWMENCGGGESSGSLPLKRTVVPRIFFCALAQQRSPALRMLTRLSGFAGPASSPSTAGRGHGWQAQSTARGERTWQAAVGQAASTGECG